MADILQQVPHIKVLEKCSHGYEALEELDKLEPDIIIVDGEMPNFNIVKFIENALEKSAKTNIIVMSNSQSEEQLFPILKAGATGYLSKNISGTGFIRAIFLAFENEIIISRGIAGKLIGEFSRLQDEIERTRLQNGLTLRETQVLSLVNNGLTNREIAEKLYITENTAKVHLHKILTKMGVRNRLQAAALAKEQGILDELA